MGREGNRREGKGGEGEGKGLKWSGGEGIVREGKGIDRGGERGGRSICLTRGTASHRGRNTALQSR